MRRSVLGFSLTLWILAVGCVEDAERRTTPRARRAAASSSDAVTGSAARKPDEPGVPGLDMRGGGGGTPAATSTPARYQNPRTLAPPWIGGRNAKVVIVEFTDFECPFCRTASQTMKRLVDHYGARIKLVFRHLPLTSIHPQARLAAEAAVCAQAQGRFWRMQEVIFKNNRNLTRADLLKYARRLGLDVPRFTKDLDSGACKRRVDRDIAAARKNKVEGTPAFIINGRKIEGALPYGRFKQLIDAELRP